MCGSSIVEEEEEGEEEEEEVEVEEKEALGLLSMQGHLVFG